MRRFVEVAVVALVLIQNANSLPQFGHSFASSSITDSTGKVLSKSVSTGKKIINGVPQLDVDLLPPYLPNEIPGIDLPVTPAFNKPVVVVPSLDVEPPLLPPENVHRNSIQQVATTTTRLTTTTTSTTARPTTKVFATKFQPAAVNSFVKQSFKSKESGNFNTINTDGTNRPIKGINDGTYRPNGKDDGRYKLNGNDGKYQTKGYDGKYQMRGVEGKYEIKGDDGVYRPKGNLGVYKHSNNGKYMQDDRGKYRGI